MRFGATAMEILVENTRYIQFLGKDNVPFHAASFPATLLSGERWKTVDVIKGFHWLSYAGGKFSTSRKRDAALEELPADLWRWWLIATAIFVLGVDTKWVARNLEEEVRFRWWGDGECPEVRTQLAASPGLGAAFRLRSSY